jgi:hypothetical protein
MRIAVTIQEVSPTDLAGLPARSGAYWLHPDGWYRLFPPAFDPTAFAAFDPSI